MVDVVLRLIVPIDRPRWPTNLPMHAARRATDSNYRDWKRTLVTVNHEPITSL